MGAGTSDRSSQERRLAWLVFALLFCSYAYFWQGGGWNPNIRLDLTRAIAAENTIAIDAYWQNTGDWAYRGGRYYSTKAPGLSVVAIPFYVIGKTGARLAGASPENILLVSGYVANLGANALPSALLGVVLFHVLGWLGMAGARLRAGVALAFGLGTPAFAYATAFYAHQGAAAFGFGAFALLLGAERYSHPRAWAAAAGAAAGVAVLYELTLVVVVVVLGAWLWLDRERRPLLRWFLIGGAPAVLLLGSYQWSAFGSPFATGYDFTNPNAETRVDGSLFGWPSPIRMLEMLFGTYRGLLPLSPIFILAPIGWPVLWRTHRAAAAVCLAVSMGFLLLISSFHAWDAGFSTGPRYLMPCFPFLFVLVGFGIARFWRVGAMLAAVSVAIMFSVTFVSIDLPIRVRYPLLQYIYPHLMQGHVSLNTYSLDSYSPPEKWQNDMNSFNLGELVFPYSLMSATPLLALWLGLGTAAWQSARRIDQTLRNPDSDDQTSEDTSA